MGCGVRGLGVRVRGSRFRVVGEPPRSSHRREKAAYRGTSLIRNSPPLGPYSRYMPRALWWSQGGCIFFVSEVPL